MSNSATQALIAILGAAVSDNYCLLAALTLYAYERCSTLDQEVHYIWHYRLSGVSILYMFLQVTTVAYFLLYAVQQLTPLRCDIALPEMILTSAISAFYEMVVSVITLLRVYAVSGGGRTVSVLVFALSMVTVAYTIYGAATLFAIAVPPPLGCAIGNTSLNTANIGITVGLATGIIADAIVLIVTWHKTYNMVRLARSANVRAPLAVILLRDGSVYFGLLATINILEIVFYITTTFQGFPFFRLSFTSVVLSRFFLNLRRASVLDVNNSGQYHSSSSGTSSTTSGIGSLGGSIAFAGDGDREEDAELDDDDDGARIDNSEGGSRDSAGVAPAGQAMLITSDV